MKTGQTIKSLLFAAAALGAMALQNASASTTTYGFYNLNNNSALPDLSKQLALDATYSSTAGGMIFRVRSDGNNPLTTPWVDSNIHEIYFDVGSNLVSSMSIRGDSDGSGTAVAYSGMYPYQTGTKRNGDPIIANASPANLPEAPFDFVSDYAADRDNCKSCGINARNEWIEFLATFGTEAGANGENILSALSTGAFRVGLHVGSIGTTEQSDSYLTPLNPVPLPAAAWLFGSALFGFMMVSNRRKV